MLVRRAVKSDIQDIQELDKESTVYHRRFDRDLYQVSEKWWKVKRKFQLAAMKDSKNLVLVAEDGKRIVGYLWGYVERLNKYNIGKIQELIVSTRYRRKGIGTRLIKNLLKFFKDKNCIIAEVTVNAKNGAAIKTYERLGFEKREYKMQLKIDKKRKFSPFA
ncbi:MAG: GNAT family N-acetyltransferase [Candidatus Aenigmatarchaeota archaeon]